MNVTVKVAFGAHDPSSPLESSRPRIIGMMPSTPGLPSIVCVLPEPVWPYAKTVALTPSSTTSASPAHASSKTSTLFASPLKTWSKS
jgi:hypothetical protein